MGAPLKFLDFEWELGTVVRECTVVEGGSESQKFIFEFLALAYSHISFKVQKVQKSCLCDFKGLKNKV